MFKVLTPGPLTTVQDLGRYGYQQFGIPPTGVLDQFSCRVANMLVGNPEGSAVLEFTFLGAGLKVLAEADVAVTGARSPISVNETPREGWMSFKVRPGDVVRIGQAEMGCRSYLAVSGGIDVSEVMESRSTYVAAGIGGYKGRALKKEDVIPRGEADLLEGSRRLPANYIPEYTPEIVLRAVPGPQDDYFDEGLKTFFELKFTVSSKANRMGCRLEGPSVIPRQGVPQSTISEPSVNGGVQIPPDGQPIILLVEQTVGGYTKIATVISADIPRVAQAKPGYEVRFKCVDVAAAHAAYHRMEARIQQIKEALAGRK
jgi:biotin-dependent carboxylase-like uncharacterized protein